MDTSKTRLKFSLATKIQIIQKKYRKYIGRLGS